MLISHLNVMLVYVKERKLHNGEKELKINPKACTLLVDYENDDMKQNFNSKNQNLSQPKKWLKFSLGK